MSKRRSPSRRPEFMSTFAKRPSDPPPGRTSPDPLDADDSELTDEADAPHEPRDSRDSPATDDPPFSSDDHLPFLAIDRLGAAADSATEDATESGDGLSPMIREAEQAWDELISARNPIAQAEIRRRLRNVCDELLQGRNSPVLRLLAERVALGSLCCDWLDAMIARAQAQAQEKLAKQLLGWRPGVHQSFLLASKLFADVARKIKR